MTFLQTYLEILDPTIKKSACGILYKIDPVDNKKEFLLIQRAADDHWPLRYEFPRGKCDKKNEDLNGCLRREVKEETGLEIVIEKFLDKVKYISESKNEVSVMCIFLCKVVDASVLKLSEEHDHFKWEKELSILQLYLPPELYRIVSKIF